MNVVTHKAVSEYGEAVLLAVIGNEEQILSPISIIFKYIVPVVASLGNVVGVIWYYQARYSWHGIMLS